MAELGSAWPDTHLCEGGGALAASLLRAGLVDQLIGYTAGMVLGAEGRPRSPGCIWRIWPTRRAFGWSKAAASAPI